MPVLNVDGDRINFVEIKGAVPSAPTLLFVHGSCGGAGQWKRLVDALAPDFHVVCIDLPGMGQSEPYPISKPWTMEIDGRAINAVIDYIDRPFHFIGHSGGCVFSWPTLQTRADEVLSCCLCEPVFFGLLREADHIRYDFVETMRTEVIGQGVSGDLESLIRFFVDHWASKDGTWESMPEKIKSSMRTGAGRLYHECIEFPKFEREPLQPPVAPTLLIEGSDTHPAMHAIHDLLEIRWPGLSRQQIPDAGHMAPFTHANQLAPIIREHVAGREPLATPVKESPA